MAEEKIEKISGNLKVISFKNEGEELSFGLLKDEDNLMVCDLKKVDGNVVGMTSSLSQTWLKDFLKEWLHRVSDSGVLRFRTPLGKYFNLTKKNLITLSNFLTSQDFIL